MGAVTAVMGAANIGMSAYQSYAEAQSKKLEADLAADSLETQAAQKDLEADAALKLGGLEAAEQDAKGRGEIARDRVAYAASGVKVNEGSAVEVAADKAAWNEYARQKIEYEADLQSWGLRYDAAMLRREAGNARASGSTSGVAIAQSAMNSVGQLLGK